jgi:hypothetical protein
MPLYDVSFAVQANSAAAVREKVCATFPKSQRRFSGALALTVEKVREKSPAEIVAMVAKQVDDATIALEQLVADLQSKTAAVSGNAQDSEQNKNMEMIRGLEDVLQNLYACDFPILEPPPKGRSAARLRLGDNDDIEPPVQ